MGEHHQESDNSSDFKEAKSQQSLPPSRVEAPKLREAETAGGGDRSDGGAGGRCLSEGLSMYQQYRERRQVSSSACHFNLFAVVVWQTLTRGTAAAEQRCHIKLAEFSQGGDKQAGVSTDYGYWGDMAA